MRRIGWLFIAIAVAVLVLSVWIVRDSIELVFRGDRVPGEVVAVDVAASSTVPAVRYVGLDRQPRLWPIPATKAGEYGPGDRVEVYRLGGDPPRAELVAFGLQWERGIVLAVLSWILFWIGRVMQLAEGDDPSTVVGYGFACVFGAPVLAGGMAAIALDTYGLATGVRTTGEVVDSSGEVRIVTAEERVVVFRDRDFDAKDVQPGQVVPVVHPPGRPHAARVTAGFGYWLAGAVLCGFGFVFTLVGVLVLRLGRGQPARVRSTRRPA